MQDIYMSDDGKGFPLVLVHGFLGSSEMWILQKKYFSKFYRVLAPAIPGFGESSNIKSYNSINEMAKIILISLESKGIKKFNLLGHSMGGMIAQEIIKIDEKKINKLICYSTGSLGNMPGRFETIDKSIENLKIVGLKKTANKISKTWFLEGEKAKYYYLCDNAIKHTTQKAAENSLLAMKKWNGFENLPNIKKETLIIWGDKDRSYNFDQVKKLEKNIYKSKLVIFKNCAHNVHLENSDKFNETIKNFLSN